MSMKSIPALTPLLYSETGVFMGTSIFLIFESKQRLWVLVRTASPRGSKCTHTLCFEQNRKGKITKKILMKILIFYNFKNLCILHGHVFVMYRKVARTKTMKIPKDLSNASDNVFFFFFFFC